MKRHIWLSAFVCLASLIVMIGPARVQSAANTTFIWRDMSSVNAPSARANHSAVWTGSEMIVWGGTGNAGYLNSGKRYNPATDAWTNMAASGLDGRVSHSAVWTGSEMLIWGGTYYEGSTHCLGDGKRYNPATDTWADISAVNAPSPRFGHSTVWTGSEMIIWGGHYEGCIMGCGRDLNDGKRYNPATNTWTEVAATTLTPRYYHSAVWTGSEMIVWGGVHSQGSVEGMRYNPITNTWRDMAPSGLTARYDNSTIWTGSEMIVWGGWGYNPEIDTHGLSEGARYDPETDTWAGVSTVNAPSPRAQHTVIWTGREMIVWGGLYQPIAPRGDLNDGKSCDPVADTWTDLPASNLAARSSHSAVWAGREMIVWGGGHNDGVTSNVWNDGQRYSMFLQIHLPLIIRG